jgi:hypothetical protein
MLPYTTSTEIEPKDPECDPLSIMWPLLFGYSSWLNALSFNYIISLQFPFPLQLD